MTGVRTDAERVARARTAARWVGLIIPLAVLLIAAAMVLAWLPEVPDPSAIHWSGDGPPDGFGPAWLNLLPIVIGVALVLLFVWLPAVLSKAHLETPGPAALTGGQLPPAATERLVAAVSLGLSALMGAVSVAAVALQRGLADAADAADIMPATAIAGAAALLLFVIGWFVQPQAPEPAASDSAPADLALTPTERAAWIGSVSIARSGRITLGIGMISVISLTAFIVARDPQNGAAWLMTGITILMLVLIGLCLAFRVRVSAAGLQVRSVLGWPRFRIRLSEIEKVEVVDVDPFRDFGGWGWRIATDGRRGVVLRTGRAVQVTRRRGRRFVVTVDGADDAAAVLEGLRRTSAED
ncbi:hypothetical protein [Microbacterium sp.]|uniref:hypothetical protein n=1 Tax=Microbacterium sp. TaxID=51671 RepID=UPI003A8E1A2B